MAAWSTDYRPHGDCPKNVFMSSVELRAVA